MSSKWNYILGAVTITAIIGGTVYAIKKSRDAQKEEEESISVAEAKDIVNKQNKEQSPTEEVVEEITNDEVEIVEVLEKKKKIKLINYVTDEDLELSREMEDEEEFEEADEDEVLGRISPSFENIEPLTNFFYYEEGINPKEDKELRFDRNSDAAKHQFIRMELAEWEDPSNPVYRVLLQLFEFPFMPTTDGDEMLRTQVIDYKVQFFGFGSKWVKEVSYADIVLHYARNAEFNIGETVRHWAEEFIDHTELDWNSNIRDIETVLGRLNSHSYFYPETSTFGLFGISRESMDEAIRIANRSMDRQVTYEIEFNEFLKEHM